MVNFRSHLARAVPQSPASIVKVINRFNERESPSFSVLHFRWVPPHMLPQKAISQASQAGLYLFVPGPVDNKIALGVEPHRPIGTICRSDRRDCIVYDQKLAVDTDRRVGGRIGGCGPIHPQSVTTRGVSKSTDQSCAEDIHRMVFKPAVTFHPGHQNDLWSLGISQPPMERLTDPMCCQILRLNEDIPSSSRNRIAIQLLDFSSLRLIFKLRLGSRNGNRAACQISGNTGRPQIGNRSAMGWHEMLTRRTMPTQPCQVTQYHSNLSSDDSMDIVKRSIATPIRVHTPRIMMLMFRRIPTSRRQVETPNKCHGVIDYDKFLVVTGSDGMAIIQVKVESRMRVPSESDRWEPLSFRGIDEGIIPIKNVHMQ